MAFTKRSRLVEFFDTALVAVSERSPRKLRADDSPNGFSHLSAEAAALGSEIIDKCWLFHSESA